MFTPPGSPFPSPRAMEEMQRQSRPSLARTTSSESDPSGPSPSGSSLHLPPTTRNLSSSSSTTPMKLSSPPSRPHKSFPFPLQTKDSDYESQNFSGSEAKRRIGRHIKWTAISIPIVLALVTLSNHCTIELLGMAGWIQNGHRPPQESVPAGYHGHEYDMFELVLDGLKPHSSSHTHHHAHHQASPLPTEATVVESKEGVLRRQTTLVASGVSATASELATPTATSASATSSTTATSTIPATAQNLPTVPTTSPILPTPFPQPWDSDISQNFSTQSCYNFFLTMTNSDSFRSCRPFGLLQSTSDTFADLQSNLTALNDVVWGTCNPTLGLDQCTTNMATFASSLQSACATDLAANNLNAVSTLQALESYSLTYSTGCLTDPSTDSYCYVKAAHNTNPSDLYFYSLPEGVSLSNTSTLTCSSCTKSLMSLYVNALNANASEMSELASVYAKAQSLAASACGSSYAQQSTSSLADSTGNGAIAMDRVWMLRTFWMALAVAVLVLLV